MEGRDGPPPAEVSSTTSTLLKEISTLRLRLKDLEDDTRSTFSIGGEEGHIMAMLRKDLAQVQQEKANLEREFMNQMSAQSSEHHSKMEALRKELETAERQNASQFEELQEKLKTEKEESEEVIADLQMKLETSEEVNKALNCKLIAAQHDSEAERCMFLLEEEREMHAKEIEQMKLNLAQTDVEIGESRREMDHLQEQLFEVQADKESLDEQVSQLRSRCETLEADLETSKTEERTAKKDLEDKIVLIEKKDEEIGEMNDALITLEEHKEMLVSEVTDIRMELSRVEDENKTLKEQAASLPEPSTPNTSIISQDEKKELEKSVEDLEGRLERFNEKLSEKDKRIDTLSASLAEERKTNKNMRKEIKALKGGSRTNKSIEAHVANEKRAGREVRDQVGEVTFLRNQNKVLNEEVKALRRRCDASPVRQSPTPTEYSQRMRSRSPARNIRPPPSSVSTPPTVSRKRGTTAASSPGISNLVASFERRIASKTGTPSPASEDEEEEATQQDVPTLQGTPEIQRVSNPEIEEKLRTESEGLKRELEDEKASVAELQSKLKTATFDLERELASERATIIELQEELEVERATVDEIHDEASKLRRDLDVKKELVSELRQQLGIEVSQVNELRTQLEKTDSKEDPATNELKGQLEERQNEIVALRNRVKELEDEQSKLEENLRTEKEEADKLRARFANIDKDQEEMEQKILLGEMAQSELAENLRTAKLEAQELKEKMDELVAERSELEKRVEEGKKDTERVKNEAALENDQLRLELNRSRQNAFGEEKKDEEYEEELVRLREQVAALQPELERSMVETETLKSVIVGLKQKIQYTEHDSKEVNALQAQLAELQVEQAGLELEYSNHVNDLENELKIVEVAAEEDIEDREKRIEELMAEVESHQQEIKRLEEERTHLCTSMNDVSMTRKDEIEELRDEIMDMTTKAAAQSREIDALKRKLDERRNDQDSVPNLKNRIKELEEDIKVQAWAARNQVQQSDIDDLRKENLKLRECIREVKLDRRTLNDRLESMLTEKSSSKSSQVLRDRNSALKQEVEKLTKRLRKMEDSITRFAI